MKAITIIQPWATLIAIGAKHIETRSWSTNYRGPLAIHAGKNKSFITKGSKNFILDKEPFYTVVHDYNYLQPAALFPLGIVIAVCNLIDVIKIPNENEMLVKNIKYKNLIFKTEETILVDVPPNGKFEYHFGDYTPGRYAWILSNVHILENPIPAKGALGMWDFSSPILSKPIYLN